MNTISLNDSLEKALGAVPILDVHTHLCSARLAARGLHDILLYHMVVSDLYSAGCPSGARLTQFPNWASKKEAHQRIEEALPYLRYIQNTSGWWGVRIILRDLYNWNEPITAYNWRRLDDQVRERADDGAWARSILKRANIQRTCAEYCRRGKGEGDDVLQYSMEWGMFMRTQWGEDDTAVYDLERTWSRPPEGPVAILGNEARPPADRTIKTVADVHAAIKHYVEVIPYEQLVSTAMGLSSDIDYRLPTDEEMAGALQRRAKAGPAERDIYAAYIGEAFLSAWRSTETRSFSSSAWGPSRCRSRRRAGFRKGPFPNWQRSSRAIRNFVSSALCRAATRTRPCARFAGNCPTSVWRDSGGTISFPPPSAMSWLSASTWSR